MNRYESAKEIYAKIGVDTDLASIIETVKIRDKTKNSSIRTVGVK